MTPQEALSEMLTDLPPGSALVTVETLAEAVHGTLNFWCVQVGEAHTGQGDCYKCEHVAAAIIDAIRGKA